VLGLRPVDLLGAWTIAVLVSLGRFGTFLGAALAAMVTPPLKFWAFIDRINFIGFRSLLIILLTGVTIYMIRAWKDGQWPFGITPELERQNAGENT